MPFKYASLQARLLANSKAARLHPADDERPWTRLPCRVWTGALSGSGYGKVAVRGRRRDKRTGHRKLKHHGAHRLALALRLGVPVWVLNHVAHECDNKPCIEGTHLWSTTPRKNVEDCVRKGRWRGPGTGKLSSSSPGRRAPALPPRRRSARPRSA